MASGNPAARREAADERSPGRPPMNPRPGLGGGDGDESWPRPARPPARPEAAVDIARIEPGRRPVLRVARGASSAAGGSLHATDPARAAAARTRRLHQARHDDRGNRSDRPSPPPSGGETLPDIGGPTRRIPVRREETTAPRSRRGKVRRPAATRWHTGRRAHHGRDGGADADSGETERHRRRPNDPWQERTARRSG